MAQEFDPIEEARKHPGVVAGAVLVLAGIGLATLLLNQRTGPRRYQVMKERFDPRGWIAAQSLRDRVSNLAQGVRHSVDDLGGKASDLGGRAHERVSQFGEGALNRSRDWTHAGRNSPQRKRHRYKKQARRYAEDAGDFALDHAREGGVILAVSILAAALGAIAWENQRKGGSLFD